MREEPHPGVQRSRPPGHRHQPVVEHPVTYARIRVRQAQRGIGPVSRIERHHTGPGSFRPFLNFPRPVIEILRMGKERVTLIIRTGLDA